MAIQHRDTATGTKAGGSGSTLTVTAPATVEAGDLLVTTVAQNSAVQTISGPSGWTLADNRQQVGSSAHTEVGQWYRIAEAGDASTNFQWSSTGTQAMMGILSAYYDDEGRAWQVLPVDTSDTSAATNSTTINTANITTTEDDALVVASVSAGRSGGGTWTPASGMTERGDIAAGAGAATLADKVQVTAGSVGAQTFTLSGTADSLASVIAAFVLEEAVSLPAPTNLVATAVSATQIDLTWDDNSDNEDGYEVERSPDGETDWTVIADLPADSTSHEDTGLEPGTEFWYRARAKQVSP